MMKLKELKTLILLAVFLFTAFSGNALATESAGFKKFKPSYFIVNLIKISNFDKVDDNYYRGAQPNEEDIKNLSKLGIKTIINLRKVYPFSRDEFDEQRKLSNSLGINYINIPMSPVKPPTARQVDEFNKILNNPQNLPVYVHCAQGRDRTGIMTAIYRVDRYGWNFNQAYDEMKKLGYHAALCPKQKDFLTRYTSFGLRFISSDKENRY